jgi:hypothetical protein
MKNAVTVFLRNVLQLLVTPNVDPTLPILVTLMMKATRSSETSVLTRATRRSIPGDGTLPNNNLFLMLERPKMKMGLNFVTLWPNQLYAY